MPEIKKILFVCVENAGRSQIAEGYFRKYAPSRYMPMSAGTQPVGKINPLVIEAMREVGIDISKQSSKLLSEDMIKQASKVVNMGCMDKESCPALFLNNPINWAIPDPKDKSLDTVRVIRDEIEKKVKELIVNLETSK